MTTMSLNLMFINIFIANLFLSANFAFSSTSIKPIFHYPERKIGNPIFSKLNSNSTFIPTQQCSAKKASYVAETFRKNLIDGTSCPSDTFLFLLANVDPSGDKLLINVGANKGYNLAIWIEAFFQRSKVSEKSWYNIMIDVDKIACNVTDDISSAKAMCCGACSDCTSFTNYSEVNSIITHDSFFYGRHNAMKHQAGFDDTIRIIAWDLNENSLVGIQHVLQSRPFLQELLVFERSSHEDTFKETNNHHYRHKRPRNLEIFSLHAAAANSNGEMEISECELGNENCSMDNNADVQKQSKKRNVRLATVDTVVCEFSSSFLNISASGGSGGNTIDCSNPTSVLPIVDILMIDAEGHDPLVLLGSNQLLSKHKVRCLIFEYHYLKPWDTFSLRDIISRLDSYNYDCYFMGNQHLWKMTGCWDDRYEMRWWSNVMCIL